MRLITGLLTAGLLTMAGLAYAAESEKPKETPPSPELGACQKQVQVLNSVLSGLGQGIQREMEFAGLKLQAAQGKREE